MLNSGIDAEDTMPVRVHEEVHARQCRELGPFRYRWQNVSSSGKFALELPAYCAAAAARLRRGDSRTLVHERLKDDVGAAFLGTVDSVVIGEKLADCGLPDARRFPRRSRAMTPSRLAATKTEAAMASLASSLSRQANSLE